MSPEQRRPFGRYSLLERLAIGGMAELYRAVLRGPYGFEKTVAIKKILPHFSADPKFRRMFLHEGLITAAANHRNVVQVFEMGEVDGELFICLELVNGCDLSQLIARRHAAGEAMDTGLAVWIAREICRGLDYLHTMNDAQGKPLCVVHLDVNPQNILLSRDGQVKLGDFGIAKSTAKVAHTLTHRLEGKLEYLAPEQARGETVGPSADIYNVGLVLYELLTQERYIQGANEANLILNAVKPVFRPIHTRFPHVPLELEKIVQRTLRIAPEGRYATASVLADALSEFQAGLPRMPDSADLAREVERVTRATPLPQPVPASPAAGGQDKPSPFFSFHDMPPGQTQSMVVPRADPVVSPQAPAARAPAWPSEPSTTQELPKLSGEPGKPAAPRLRPWLLAGLLLLAGGLGLWTLWPREAAPVPPPLVPVAPPLPRALAGPEPALTEALALPPIPTPAPGPLQKPARKTLARLTPKADPSRPSRPASARIDAPALQQEMSKLRARMHKRGLRPGDSPELDALGVQFPQRLRQKDHAGARQTLDRMEETLENTVIDQRFVERKMQRLQKALEKNHASEKFSQPVRDILNLTLKVRFPEANEALNALFDQLGDRR